MKRLYALLLLAVALFHGGACADEPRTGKLAGQIMINDSLPMSEGLVYLYNTATGPAPSRDRFWRVPDRVARMDNEGRFSADLPEGEYYLGAIKRNGPTRIGPPLPDDYLFFSLDENSWPRKYRVISGEPHNIGTVKGALQFKSFAFTKDLTAIEGIIQDQDGRPVEGVIVFAFVTPTITGKPLFVSERSDSAGKFLLRVHQGGTFYLKVRDHFGGGIPVSGAIYDGGKDEPMQQVTVETGKIVGNVRLEATTFQGRGRNKE